MKTCTWEYLISGDNLLSSQKCLPTAMGTSTNDRNDQIKCWPMRRTPELKLLGQRAEFSFDSGRPVDEARAVTPVLVEARKEHAKQI